MDCRLASRILLGRALLVQGLACAALAGCASEQPVDAIAGTQWVFDLAGYDQGQAAFFDLPFPSDLRRGSTKINIADFPNRKDNAIVASFITQAGERSGFSTVPVGYFRFAGALKTRVLDDWQSDEPTPPFALIDIDADSPTFGQRYPVTAQTVARDVYVPEHLLALAVRPGVVLTARHRYAFIVLRQARDANGELLGVPRVLEQLKAGITPDGVSQASAAHHFALWPLLERAGVPLDDLAAVAAFTTDDVVSELFELSESARQANPSTIAKLTLSATAADQPRFCRLSGQIVLPQFQRGQPPFDQDGVLVIDQQRQLVKQTDVTVPLTLVIPKSPMPSAGYPLLIYVHGSGGDTDELVDRGPVSTAGGIPKAGEGPAYVVAAAGVASATMAMPINPQRVPGAGDYDYLNFGNLQSFRDIFRQGAIELRIFIDALSRLKIDPSVLAGCAGPALPAGASAYRFATGRIALMGQSMGAQYAALVGAIEPRVGLVLPTGGGGYWSHFIFRSPEIPTSLLPPLLGTLNETRRTHPAIHLLQLAWEPVDPIVYAPRLSWRPLTGHAPRHVYQPAGLGDSFFDRTTFDAMAAAYGHHQAGEQVWPSMQQALGMVGRDGIKPYPVQGNLQSPSGGSYTGVVVQYRGDGIGDPHGIAFQLDAVKYQYRCFVTDFFAEQTPRVREPGALDAPCD